MIPHLVYMLGAMLLQLASAGSDQPCLKFAGFNFERKISSPQAQVAWDLAAPEEKEFQQLVSNFIERRKAEASQPNSLPHKTEVIDGREYSYRAKLGSGADGAVFLLEAPGMPPVVAKIFDGEALIAPALSGLAYYSGANIPTIKTLGRNARAVFFEYIPGLSTQEVLAGASPELRTRISNILVEIKQQHPMVDELNILLYAENGKLKFKVNDAF